MWFSSRADYALVAGPFEKTTASSNKHCSSLVFICLPFPESAGYVRAPLANEKIGPPVGKGSTRTQELCLTAKRAPIGPSTGKHIKTNITKG